MHLWKGRFYQNACFEICKDYLLGGVKWCRNLF
jgi:hypothetical protein